MSYLLFNEISAGGGKSGAYFLRELDSSSPAIRLGEGIAVDLSADGRFVLAYDPLLPNRYELVPTGIGQAKTLDLGAVDSVWAWFLPDRREILINGREPDRDWRYYLVDPDGGKPMAVSPEGMDHFRGQKVVSPDGRRIAGFMTGGRITRIFSLDGGDPVDVLGLEPQDIVMRWSTDGRALFVFNRDSLPMKIHRVELDTGERTLMHTLVPTDPAGIRGIELVNMTPDGQFYTYSYVRRLDALYVIEGID